MHALYLHTELALQVSQLQKQLQELMEVHLPKVYASALLSIVHVCSTRT